MENQSQRRQPGRLTQEQWDKLTRRSAEHAADLLESRLRYAVGVGKQVIYILLWLHWAGSIAFALYHHETIAKLIWG